MFHKIEGRVNLVNIQVLAYLQLDKGDKVRSSVSKNTQETQTTIRVAVCHTTIF